MKTIAELKEELQGNKRRAKKWFWGHTQLIHTPSIYMTYLLLRSGWGITANQMTIVMFILGVLGVSFLFSPIFLHKIIGLVLMYFHQITDSMDGEVARYRKTFSLKGIFLDDISHLLLPALFFIGITLGISSITPFNSHLLVIVGVVGGLSWSILKGTGKESVHLFAKHYLKNSDKYSLPESSMEQQGKVFKKISPENQTSFVRQILAIRFQIRQFFIAFIGATIVIVIDYIFFVEEIGYLITSWFVVIYGLFLILHLVEELVKNYVLIESLVADHFNNLKENKDKLFKESSN